MKITLPLPPACLSPNARVHWAAKAKAAKTMRELACLNAKAWCNENENTYPWREATMQLTFYFKTAARRDPDNCLSSCKSVIDGIVDAGVLLDDDMITHLPVVRMKDKDNPRLEMEISNGH